MASEKCVCVRAGGVCFGWRTKCCGESTGSVCVCVLLRMKRLAKEQIKRMQQAGVSGEWNCSDTLSLLRRVYDTSRYCKKQEHVEHFQNGLLFAGAEAMGE